MLIFEGGERNKKLKTQKSLSATVNNTNFA